IFGCIAYVHIPDNLRKKLDDKSTTCVHLGISEESKAYKLYDPIKRKILVSKDVKFDERKQWNWENKVAEKSNSNKQVIDCEADAETCSTSSHNENPNETGDYEIGESSDNQAFFSPSEDPITYSEAAKHEVWKKAIDTEIAAIESNDTWELTHLPPGAKKIGVKWVYKTKLVAKGYSQQHGIDYNEVFAPVARWDTIRTILAIVAAKNWLSDGEKGNGV
ncbi:retrotransposon-related protein, partial [Trifolium pratense]